MSLRVEVCQAPAGGAVQRQPLNLPAGSRVADALQALGWTLPEGGTLAIWGRRVSADTVLRDGDRVLLLRGLKVDPKQARHRRHALTGQRRIVSRHRPG